MGVLQNPLGISITDHNPLLDSPYNNSFNSGDSFPPPGSERMITEITGEYMITEITLDYMITE